MVHLRRELTDIVDDACLMASAAAPSTVLISKCHPASVIGSVAYTVTAGFIHSFRQPGGNHFNNTNLLWSSLLTNDKY